MNKKTLSEKILSHARKNPEKKVIMEPGGRYARYRDYAAVYEATSGFFREKGIKEYDRIAVMSNDDFALALITLPVMESVAAALLDAEHPEQQLAEVMELMKITYVLTDRQDTPVIEAAKKLGIGIIVFELKDSVESIECHYSLRMRPSVMRIPENLRNPDIAVLQTTSGTTSKPKIVPMHYASQVYGTEKTIEHYQMDHHSFPVVLVKMSRGNSVSIVIRALYSGGQVMIANSLNHHELLELLNNTPITQFKASPAYLQSLVKYINQQRISVTNHSLSFIQSSGAPLSPHLRQRLMDVFGVSVEQEYGMTETKAIATTYRAPKGYKEHSSGIPVGIEVRVMNDEILVRGECVFKGYETEDEMDRSRFTDNWFHTGDTGYLDEDGYLFITGRIKEMINRGGEKISPYEVEKAILTHPQVVDTAVFPWPNDDGSEEVGAAIVLKDQVTLSLVELRKFLSVKVATFKLPTLLYLVDQIPASKAGKVQRKTLHSQLKEETPDDRQMEKTQPIFQNSTQQWKNNKLDLVTRLQWLWQYILKLEKVELNDHFFHMGGDSLDVASLLSVIYDEFNIQVPVNDFYKNPTINNLVSLIKKLEPEVNTFHFLVPLKGEGKGKPLFCINTLNGEVVAYQPLVDLIEERPIYGLRIKTEGTDWEKPYNFTEIAKRFIAEMKMISPQGPYHLFGLCFGGKIAYEIACQLQDAGEEVALLAIQNTPFSTNNRTKKYDAAFIARALMRKSNRAFRTLSEQQMTQWPRYALSKFGALSKYLRTIRQLNHYKDVKAIETQKLEKEAFLSLAGKNHEARHFNGRLIYFQPKIEPALIERKLSKWRKVVKTLKVIPLQGELDAFLDPQNRKLVAETLNKAMAENPSASN